MFFRKRKSEKDKAEQSVPVETSEWLADNVLCQSQGQPLAPLLAKHAEPLVRSGPISLVHVVNLFSVGGDLDDVQRMTVDSMRRAAATDLARDGKVTLVQVGASTDRGLGVDGFANAAMLERDSRDLARFGKPRPLPLLFDVLERGADLAGPDDFVVFTNADICLQPHFYGVVRSILSSGFDAITINRRTLPELSEMQGDLMHFAEPGKYHRGFDCFVFSKVAFEEFIRSDCIVGMPAVARPLLYNMVARSKRMLMLKDVCLTYHFGNDRSWKQEDYSDYRMHNLNACMATIEKLSEAESVRACLEAFCLNHNEPKIVRRFFTS